MTEKYKTQIRNHCSRIVNLPAPKNYVYRTIFLQPNATVTISFSDPQYLLAPYERVVYRKSGAVDCKKRAGFKRDLKFPTCRFLNNGNTDTEALRITDHDVQLLPRGLEIVRHVPFFSTYAEYESVTISQPKERFVPEYNSGNLKRELRPHIIYKKRNGKELERFKKMREASYLKSVGLGVGE